MYTRTAFPYETTHEDIWIPPADGTRLYAGRGTRPRRPAVGPRARRPGDVTRHPGEAPGDGGPVHPYVAVAPGPGPVRGRRRRPLGRLRDPCGRPGGGRLARPAARLGTTPDPEPPSGPGDVGSPLPRSYGMDAHPPATTCASLPRLPGGRHRLVLPLGHPRRVRAPGCAGARALPSAHRRGRGSLPPRRRRRGPLAGPPGGSGPGDRPRCAARPATAPRPWSLGVPCACQRATAVIRRSPRSRALRRTYVST